MDRFSMERRTYTRIPFEIESVIRYDTRTIRGVILNISLKGMYIDVPERLPNHVMVDVELLLASTGASKTIILQGQVIRSESGGTAVMIMKLDLDSYIILRDLMMDRSGKPELIMDEFCRFIADRSDCHS